MSHCTVMKYSSLVICAPSLKFDCGRRNLTLNDEYFVFGALRVNILQEDTGSPVPVDEMSNRY